MTGSNTLGSTAISGTLEYAMTETSDRTTRNTRQTQNVHPGVMFMVMTGGNNGY